MSKAVVDGVIEYNSRTDDNIGLIASRRQVDMNHGYSNNWNTEDFVKYVKSKDKNILVCRDHGGIMQGSIEDYGLKSMIADVVAGMDIIHIDPWKSKDYRYSMLYTITAILTLAEYSDTVQFEIGTEQSIFEYSANEIDGFLFDVHNGVGDLFSRIKYSVIQSGTSLQSGENTGSYDESRLKSMIDVCKYHKLLSKEHNGDYIGVELLKHKLSLGLDAINIAPELAGIENKILLDKMNIDQKTLWSILTKNDSQWAKWFPKGFTLKEDSIDEVLSICGHYVLSHKDFKDIFDITLVENDVIEGVCNFLKERSI